MIFKWLKERRKKQSETPPESDEQLAKKVFDFYYPYMVTAIKELRQMTGLGLKEAKALIDNVKLSYTEDQLEALRAKNSVGKTNREDEHFRKSVERRADR